MTFPLKALSTLLTALGSLSFASLAAAGSPSGVAIITYGPGATAVPTMGGTMLIALAVILALVAFRLLKDRPQAGSNMVIAIAAITALASGTGGIKLIADARADNVLSMSSSSGGEITIPSPGVWVVSNPTELEQSIKQIDYAPDCGPGMIMAEPLALNGAVPVSSCSTSTKLAPGGTETCEIAVSCFTET